MITGTILKSTEVNYTKEGKDKTLFAYDVLTSDGAIDTFTTQTKEFEPKDNVFIIEVNGYKRGYKQDAVSKESVKAVKDFKSEWDKMWS